MTTVDCEQGTTLWRDVRSGKVTASRIADVLRKGKGQKESSSRNNYRAQLVCEILTGKAMEDNYVSYWMKRGLELEPIARAEYELKQGVIVDTVGFVPHPSIPRSGASPDGTVGADGLVQFKCVTTANHLDWLMARIVPSEHRGQMYFEMACTGRQWSDFVSFEPNLPPQFQLFIARLKRDDVAIAEIESEVMKFNGEIDEILSKLSTNLDGDLTEILEQSVKAVAAK
jgi:hypothetical protein